jgi:hypothetical protein
MYNHRLTGLAKVEILILIWGSVTSSLPVLSLSYRQQVICMLDIDICLWSPNIGRVILKTIQLVWVFNSGSNQPSLLTPVPPASLVGGFFVDRAFFTQYAFSM